MVEEGNGVTVDESPPGNIIHAAYVGALEVVKTMVEGGTPADQPDSLQGSTPLHWACFGGHLNVVRWLVQKAGADPNRPNNDGCTPLLFACEMGHTGVAQWLVREGGAEVNAKEFVSWQTPLHRVISKAQLKDGVTSTDEEDLILWLVEAGADLGAMDRFGKRAQDIAMGKAFEENDPSNSESTAGISNKTSEGDGTAAKNCKRTKLLEIIVAAREDKDGVATERLKKRNSAVRNSTAKVSVQLSPKFEAKQRMRKSRAKQGALYTSAHLSPPHGGGSGGSGGGVAAPPAGAPERVGGGPPAPIVAEGDFFGEEPEGGSRYMEEMVTLFGGGKASNGRAVRGQQSGRVQHEEEHRRLRSKADDEKWDLQSIRVAEDALRKAGMEISAAQASLVDEDQWRQDEAVVVKNIRELAQKKALGLINEEEFMAKKRQVLEMEQLRRDVVEETRMREEGEIEDAGAGILTSVGQNTPPPSSKESSESGKDEEREPPCLSKPSPKDQRRTYKTSDLDKYSIINSSEPRVFGPVPDSVKESLAARDSVAKHRGALALDALAEGDASNIQKPEMNLADSRLNVDVVSTVDGTFAGPDIVGGAKRQGGQSSDLEINDDGIHGRSCCIIM